MAGILDVTAVARVTQQAPELLAHYIGTPGVTMALNHTAEAAPAKAPTGSVDPTRR